MVSFAIIEVEDGLTIVEVQPNEKPADVAVKHGGLLVDPRPYPSYEEANEALIALQAEEEDETSDAPIDLKPDDKEEDRA